MDTNQPRATFRLLKDYRPGSDPGAQLSELRAQLAAVPDLSAAALSPEGASTVIATLPAVNRRQKDRLKSLLAESIDGWSVIEDSSYGLPKTF